MNIIINPGTGPVDAATEEHAKANIDQFCKDLVDPTIRPNTEIPSGLRTWSSRGNKDGDLTLIRTSVERARDEGGRFRFRLFAPGGGCTIDMPGTPLARVRYLDKPSQNIWNYSRLYVDDNSWVWYFAVAIARDAFKPKDSDE